MESNIKLGRIWGVPIGLHSSWFLIFGLVTFSLAVGYFPVEYADLPPGAYWLLGVLTAVLFFGSVLAHELGHVRVALRERVPVRGVTLFLFGGVAEIEDEPRTAGAEFRIAIAGPVVSLALAVLFGLVYLLDRSISPYLAAPSLWLARINLALAVFNMIPGFPLDGGRVLRAAIWQFTGSQARATRIAGGTGQLVAYGFIGLGTVGILMGGVFNGLWLIFIGWFLQNAARSAVVQSNVQDRLRGITVDQVMIRDCVAVPHSFSVKELVEDRMMLRGQQCFLVSDGGMVTGMITPNNLAVLSRDQWGALTVGDIVDNREWGSVVDPFTDLVDALRMMDRQNINQMPVVDNQQVVGILSRDQIVRMLRLRTQLGY
ncbi:MAG: CBS domain-containing protein [Chloroflexi bacterium]|nr:CBS domain-containing protein [Chloroflexota bacterium]